jgi:hypothetical protein
MVPTQFMAGAVAMAADSSPQLPYLSDQFVSSEFFKVFVHFYVPYLLWIRENRKQWTDGRRTQEPILPPVARPVLPVAIPWACSIG